EYSETVIHPLADGLRCGHSSRDRRGCIPIRTNLNEDPTMSRSRQPRSQLRRREVFPVRVELLEDRIGPGTVIGLPGLPWAELTYGGLARGPISALLAERWPAGSVQTVSPSHGSRLDRSADPHSTLGTHTSLLTPSSLGEHREETPAVAGLPDETSV